MLKQLFEFLNGFPAFREAFDAQATGISAVYETAEGQRPFYAALLAEQTGRPVVYIAPSDMAAMRAADDCGAWLGGGAATLTAPDAHFIRGTASREGSFRRLEVLQRAREGKIRVLCVGADAVLCRMLPPDRFEEQAVRLRSGDTMEPGELIARLVRMGYERVDMVEGKGQCALRGAIVDAFSPAENGATRIEFWDDEVDSIRAFDPISQRSLEKMEEAVFYPGVEWLLPPSCAPAMRAMIRAQMNRLPDSPLSSQLPPLPEDEEEPAADASPAFRVYDTGVSRLLKDADQLEAGLQPPQLALWAGALDVPCAWIWEYLDRPILVLEEPERIKARCDDRCAGFAEDFLLTFDMPATHHELAVAHHRIDSAGIRGIHPITIDVVARHHAFVVQIN